MSIFGKAFPKIIVNISTTEDEVLLPHAVILKDEPEYITGSSRSVRTGKKVFVPSSKHWLFQIKIYLYKYDDPETSYLELKSYEGTEVYLFRHSDGYIVLDGFGNRAVFVLTSVDEDYTDEKNKYDILTLTLRTRTPISPLVSPVPSMYNTAYLMNHIDDDPVGSIGTINPTYLYDVLNIPTSHSSPPTVKGLESQGERIEETHNGFTVIKYSGSSPGWNPCIYRSASLDLFDGVTDLTLIVAFKKRTIDTVRDCMIFSHYTPNNAQALSLAVTRNHKLGVGMLNLAGILDPTVIEGVTATTEENYDDDAWHIAVVIYDQTEKTVHLYTDLGEHVTDTNEDYESATLDTDIVSNPQIGYWRHPNPNGLGVENMAYFGIRDSSNNINNYIGDILFFNKKLIIWEINYWADWVAERLNITWERI